MRRLNFLLVALLFFAIVAERETTAFGGEYMQYEVFADSDFSHTHNVCIDPGHGGPTAQKYWDNGDGAGTHGCCYGLSEQWVNLQVAYALRDSLSLWGSCPNQIVWGIIMTREGWTDIPAPPPGLWRRVRWANYANCGYPVNEFISIHHNGFDDTSHADQAPESFWWNSIWTDSSATRDTTSKLARKVRMKIHDNFNIDAECYECYKDNRGTKAVDFFVLKNSRPASVLSEASDIRAQIHWEEELQFMDSTVFWHAMVEAGGIVRGWCSFKNNSGFVTIRNSAITGNDGFLWTDWEQVGSIQWDSPYYTVWEEGEQGWIDFPPYQYIGGVMVYFHHIEEFEHGYYSTNRSLFYVVPHCSTHTIVAYWTGGPYSAQLYSPNGGQQWHTCEQKNITWNASVGADSTTRMNVYLSRNGGSDFELLSADLPNTGSYNWKVFGLASSQCRIKVVAHDTAGNQASDVSDQNFTIQGFSVTVTSPYGGAIWHIGEQRTISWSSAYLCTTSHADIYISRDGGNNYVPIISDLLNTGSYA